MFAAAGLVCDVSRAVFIGGFVRVRGLRDVSMVCKRTPDVARDVVRLVVPCCQQSVSDGLALETGDAPHAV